MAYMKMKLIEGWIYLELTGWITHIKAHSLQSLMHTYFLWKRPKATQFDLGFFITPDRPYTLHIGLKNGLILTFWGFMFNIQGVYPGKKQSYKK